MKFLLSLSLIVSIALNDEAKSAVDTTIGINQFAHAFARQSDSKILVVGNFTEVNGVHRNRIARLNNDGTLDLAFNPNANGSVSAIAIQEDGKILVGGLFTSIGGITHHGIARLNQNGSLDGSFDADLDSYGFSALYVNSIAVQANGKILMGGAFSYRVDEAIGTNLVRFNADGAFDSNFSGQNIDFDIAAVVIQADDKILIGGSFQSIDGKIRRGIARLTTEGSVDLTFDESSLFDGRVDSIAIQTDGGILVGGAFSEVGGVSRDNVARLDPHGVLDPAFTPNINGSVYTVKLQEDGKIVVGGVFTEINGMSRKSIARLSVDGSLDRCFNHHIPGSDIILKPIEFQTDSGLWIGVNFKSIDGEYNDSIFRLIGDQCIDDELCVPVVASNGKLSLVCL